MDFSFKYIQFELSPLNIERSDLQKNFEKFEKNWSLIWKLKKLYLSLYYKKIRNIQFKIAIKIVKPEKLKFTKGDGCDAPLLYLLTF